MPGRNEPCPCGSGKKYKRCCALSAAKGVSAKQGPGIDMALVQLEEGNFPATVATATAYLKSHHNDPTGWQVLGIAQYYLKEFKQAVIAFEKVTKLDKQNPDGWNNLGLMLFELGKLEEAISACKYALKLQPDMPGALNNLGNALRASGKPQQAERYYQQAIQAGMQSAEVFCNLGTVQHELGASIAAEQSYTTALKIDPDFIPAMNNLATHCLLSEDLAGARSWLDRGLAVKTDDPDLLCSSGKYYKLMGEYDQAIVLFKRALSQDDHHLDALIELAELLYEQSRVAEASSYINKFIELGGLTNVHAAKVYCKYLIGNHRYKETLAVWEGLLRDHENNRVVQSGLAEYYAAIGDFDKAASIYSDYLTINPNDTVMLLDWSMMEEARHNLDKSIELVNKVLDGEPGQVQARLTLARLLLRTKDAKGALREIDKIDFANDNYVASNVLYERAIILDKLERYDEAYLALEQASGYKARMIGVEYQRAEEQQAFKNTQAVFNRDNSLVSFDLPAKQESATPIFIVGFPRSGTTLVEQILAAHSQIAAGDELSFINECKNKINELTGSDKAYPFNLLDSEHPLNQDLVKKLRDYYIERVREKGVLDQGHLIFTDKLPHNLHNLGLINLLFPESYVLHVIRHPMDACLSAYMANFGYGSGHLYTLSMQDTARHYALTMELAEYYKKVLDMRYLQIRYEDIVESPEQKIHEIIEFVDLPWEDACLSFYDSKRVSKTASYAQVTQKIYTTSRYRYKHYYNQLKPYANILQTAMDNFGYDFEP
jgi:tetratricopeptide (TPR) repeat protein